MDASQPLAQETSTAPGVHIPPQQPPPPPPLAPPASQLVAPPDHFAQLPPPATTSTNAPHQHAPAPAMPDIAASPRKAVSSVSANARAQQPQKKPGAPKPKGAVRAKSGCYTCRIRRKKCDEQPNGEGACQTCVRLRLQCLGFGAKRPDWMRENNSVTELREKIKAFLASQGMIKGHSGSGPRSNEGEPQILTLVDNLQPQPPSGTSPPTPTLSASSSDGHRPQQNPVSYVRDAGSYHHPPSMQQDQQQHSYAPPPSQTTWSNHLPELGAPHHPAHHHDASLGRGPLLPNDILYPNPILNPTSIVNPPPSSSSSWLSHNGSSYALTTPFAHPQAQQQMQPQLNSSFSRLYSAPINYTSDEEAQDSPDGLVPNLPLTINTADPYIPPEQSELIQHYMFNVLPIQYLLSESSKIRTFIYQLIQESSSARDAACMLAAIHRHRMGYPTTTSGTALMNAANGLYHRLFQNLAQRAHYSEANFTKGDAMAGLHAVSTILFSGGRGSWETFLNVASSYVWKVIREHISPEEALRKMEESTRFIVKTTMWFDVLASVTTQKVPRFLQMYRELFDRSGRAFIGEAPQVAPPEISMLPVMGCENNIVLAIAEISNLACWKESQTKQNALSVPKLVELGLDIENKFLTPGGASSPSAIRGAHGLPGVSAHASTSYGLGLGIDPTMNPIHGPVQGPMPPAMPMGNGASEVELRRRLTNDIFRASARVYLHTVLSGDYPQCPEIVRAVEDTIACLKRIPLDRALVSRSVLRSVVFGICISGCLTDNIQQRKFLMELLDTQQRESVGNVAEVRRLMQQVWDRRDSGAALGQSVNWRDVMRESQRELLLLV